MLTTLLAQLKNQPDTVEFKDVIDCIAATYLYTPSQFTNGDQVNEAGQNQGSCKIFAFAQLNNLDEQSTLHCFGDWPRQLRNPGGR